MPVTRSEAMFFTAGLVIGAAAGASLPISSLGFDGSVFGHWHSSSKNEIKDNLAVSPAQALNYRATRVARSKSRPISREVRNVCALGKNIGAKRAEARTKMVTCTK